MTTRLSRAGSLVVAASLSLLQPLAAAAQPSGLRVEKGSQLEVRFVGHPWRPDIFQGFEEGGPNARSWAFARLVASSYFALDGARLAPGHYAMVLNPRTGTLPMTLELRRTSTSEFLLDVPAMAAPPAGESVYKRPVAFKPGSEPTPALDVTVASWSEGSLLTVRYGDRKLVLELPRASPY